MSSSSHMLNLHAEQPADDFGFDWTLLAVSPEMEREQNRLIDGNIGRDRNGQNSVSLATCN